MKKRIRKNQKRPSRRANAHFTPSDSKGTSLSPPPFMLSSSNTVQRKKLPIQRQSKEDENKVDFPGLAKIFQNIGSNASKYRSTTKAVEAWNKSRSGDNSPTKTDHFGRITGVALSGLSEYSSRKAAGESTKDALTGATAKGSLKALMTSKRFKDKLTERMGSTSRGKTALKSATGLAGGLAQTIGALTGNEDLEDAGKAVSVVAELNPKGLVQKGITEGMMGHADIAIALTQKDKRKALSKIHDQNLSGSKGDIRQGYSMIAATLAGDTRSIARLGSNGKLKGLGRIGWKAGGVMADHDVLGWKAKEKRSWDRARKLSLYRFMIKAKYGSWKTGVGRENALRYEKTFKVMQDRLFLDMLRQMKTIDPSLYRLGLPYAF